MADYLVREEDGTSHLIKEEGGGDLLLEESTGAATIDRAAALDGVGAVTVAGSGTFDPTRITQVPIEVIVSTLGAPSLVRVTQVPIEVIVAGASVARVTQAPIEVVVQNTNLVVNVDLVYWTVGDA